MILVFCPHNSDIVSGEDIDFCGLRQEVSSCLVIVVRGPERAGFNERIIITQN